MKKLKTILIMSLLLLIVLSFLFGFTFSKYKKQRYTALNDINNEVIEEKEVMSATYEEINYKEELDNYRHEYSNNEIIGKFSILNSDFSVLFAQSEDNDYYLTHLLNKEYNKLGSTFLDYRVDVDESKKINIYAHNNGNVGISFNYLMNYLDENFYKEHKKILINTNTDNYIYEIFSIQIVDSNYIHMIVDFDNDEEWQSYLKDVLSNSIFYEEIELDNTNKVLTLQTCTNRRDGEYLLVNARLTNI